VFGITEESVVRCDEGCSMTAAGGATIGTEETKMLKNKIYYRSAFD
jgi:hypothetical protein